MLKSPKSKTDGEMAHSWVKNSERSEGNAGFSGGGQ